MKKYLALLLVLLSLLTLACCGKEEPEEIPPEEPEISQETLPEEADKEPEPELPKDDPELPSAFTVMIDNHSGARPQSGLDKADVVFEIEAEGGITRYMALFYNQGCEKVGPVRSCRYYFAQLAKGIGGVYVHLGASTDGYETLSAEKVQDIDGITAPASQFWRSKDRKMPHNAYTSTDILKEMADKKGYTYSVPALPGYGVEFEGAETSGNIGIKYNSSYNVGYRWADKEELEKAGVEKEGAYVRQVKGKDSSTLEGDLITADTIYVLETTVLTRNTDPVTSEVDVIGSGRALRFVDNKVVEGTWSKKSASEPLIFTDAEGKELCRKFGNTWIQVIPDLAEVTY